MATTTAFDFKGHPTAETRQLVYNPTTQPDWTSLLGEDTVTDMQAAAASLLSAETFSASSEHDALGRVLTAISPDGSEVHYAYDEGGGLQKVETYEEALLHSGAGHEDIVSATTDLGWAQRYGTHHIQYEIPVSVWSQLE